MQVETIPTSPAELRALFRSGELARPTSGMAPGRVQANLVVLPKDLAFDFLLFCQRNPKPCPLLEVVEAGSSEPEAFAPGADLRTDVPMYRVYENGELTAEVEDVSDYWRDDMVSFLLGCSFTFESALVNGGVPLHHFETGSNVPMFITNVPTQSAGAFSGPLVVSMRPVPKDKLVKAVQITSRFPGVHGAPDPHRQPGRYWRPRRPLPGSRRPYDLQGRRRACVLGVRCHAAGRGHELQASPHDHPLTWAHVHHRRQGRRLGCPVARPRHT